MPFDQSTRNRLARFVGDSRALLTEEFTRQLQHDYGLDPASGEVTDLARLTHLDDARRETARLLRETLAHYLAGQAKPTAKARRESLARIAREQAFTVLNRLCALRMLEARGLLLESVGRGYQSKGFQLYSRLAGPALGETGEAYRSYLFSLFDEFAIDLPVLFDRFSPQGRLFPRPATLLRLLDEINQADIDPLWAEDETIGWIYQYFNTSDERRQMRAASQAPRNSRELAVRNQFFTPRYVVEFLTDNTLGRLWYEMTQGQTALTERCRYLVRRPNEIFLNKGETANERMGESANLRMDESTNDQGQMTNDSSSLVTRHSSLADPVYIPYRPLKDPRDIKMLDPACGSMHFGLYAFDLFEQIYGEAWALESERGPAALHRSPGLKPLAESYPDEAAFRRDIPRLIIECNIHGIDIDPRAVQIAGLSLWLRAQKSWQGQGLNAAGRPEIKKSNVVTAEPMPGDAALLDDFIDRHLSHTPEEKLLGQLLRRVFDAMTLAGEAGALLKIEEEIAADIAEAKAKWHAKPTAKQASFLEETPQPEQVELGLDVSGITGEAFWEQAEQRIYAALQQYAEQAENGHTLRRRLFAGDAARGFAFIDLCRRKYDVVLMNPPFGALSLRSESQMRQEWGSHANDIYVIFVLQTIKRLNSSGLVGIISSRGFLIGRDQRDFRPLIMGKGEATLSLLVDLGLRVLDDAEVETCAYVIEKLRKDEGVFFDFRAVERSQLDQLRVFLKEHKPYARQLASFLALPNAPLMYRATTDAMSSYSEDSSLDPDFGRVTKGLSTCKDERFIFLFWEVNNSDIERRWKYCAKGADYLWFVSNIHTVVDWLYDGDYIATFVATVSSNVAQARRSSAFYFKSGATYTYRCDDFSLRALPRDSIFTNAGPVIIPNEPEQLPKLFALFFSEKYSELLSHISKKGKYDTGRLKFLPPPTGNVTQQLESKWKQLSDYLLSFEGTIETTPYFLVFSNKTEIFDKKNFQNLVCKFVKCVNLTCSENFLNAATRLLSSRYTHLEKPYTEYFSSAVGYIFGRWDIRYATGQKEVPELPDPFDPLPVCPPGMLQNSQGLPAAPADVPPDYPLRITWPGLLVDDPGLPEDIEARVREALRVIWPDTADAIEQEACQILGVSSLRDYLGNPNKFFDDHLKRYSKSRRYAPIYWPLSIPSGSYTLWLYYHRLDNQILYSAINDFVDPKLKHVGQQAGALRQKTNRSKTEEDDLTRLTDLEAELHDFRAELLRLAASWRPNLNDGVQITAAPLWRLFQNRKWQKRLQKTWDQLEAGDYDWAHLAMSLWPARVVPKCVDDRSLAIAHGVEDLFWVEDDGNWRSVQPVEQELAGQIARRQQPAHQRLRQHLADLAQSAGRGLPAYQVWQHLREGDWDDTPLALALWPERVAAKCWDQPFLAGQLNLKMPGKRTKTARKRFLKKLLKDSTPELVDAVAVAFQDESAAFDAVWQALTAGERDEQPLALALWPQRVLDKCIADVELALRHEVARYFWVQPSGSDSWRRRNPQAQEVRDEVARRKGL